jgi:ADP-ribosyl-[dinitrogen reductase] hydrolase
LACGDAVGTTVEFCPRGSFRPLKTMVGGGPFRLKAGQWTDDTSMALCLAASLIGCEGFDPLDQMTRYERWARTGYMSATGTCFDIGRTVSMALERFSRDRNPFAGSDDPSTAGNGALMRLAPVVLFYAEDTATAIHHARQSTSLTHNAPEALECSALFAEILLRACEGAAKEDVLAPSRQTFASRKIRDIADGDYRLKQAMQIKGSGYCVESLEAALWCFDKAATFEETVLMAANLGDDADTTAAIAGQLAGGFYGVRAIPEPWLEKLWWREKIMELATQLFEHRYHKNKPPAEGLPQVV